MRGVATMALCALLSTTAGCAASGVRQNDDGTLSIECAGGYHDWSVCYERAAAACRPDEPEIVSQVSNEGAEGVGSRDWSAEGSVVSRTLVVRCGPSS